MTPRTVCLGVDPGISLSSPGALALVDAAGPRILLACDLPLSRDRKDRPILDESAFRIFMEAWAPRVRLAVVEEPTSHGQEGRASLWRFATVCAQIPTILRCLGIETKLVSPSAWKAAMGFTREKRVSLEWVRKRFPDSTAFERVKDHGRAEAVALAMLGLDRFWAFVGQGG